MNTGWVRIWRKIEENPLWLSDVFSRGQAWIDLIVFANHKDNFFYIRNNKIEIERGQIGWSEVRMSKRWKWSRNKVRNFLKMLQKEQQIEITKSSITTIITILNYEKFQSEKTADDTAEGQQTIQQTIQQKDSRLNTNNNDNNGNNDKNDNKRVPTQVDKHLKNKRHELTDKDLTAEDLEELKLKFPNIDIGGEWEKARDWLVSKNEKMANYKAFFRNWLRRVNPPTKERNWVRL
jgi:hypothetical protein